MTNSSQWDLSRSEDQTTSPPGTDLVVLIPPETGAAPTTRTLAHLAADLGVPTGRGPGAFTPGYIERMAGHSLPDTVTVAWDDGTVPPVTVLSPLTAVKTIQTGMIVGLEVIATGGGGGLRPNLILDLRDQDGATVSTRITVDTTGELAYHQVEITGGPARNVSVALEGVDGTDSGDFTVEFRDILAFTGTGIGARIVAQIADRLVNLEDTMGITTAEAIDLINQLVPPAQRVPPLAGHGNGIIRVSADAAALHLVAPAAIADDTTAGWAQPGRPDPADALPPLLVRRWTPHYRSGYEPRVDHATNNDPVAAFIQSTAGTFTTLPTADNWGTQPYPPSPNYPLVETFRFDAGINYTEIQLPHGEYTLDGEIDVAVTGDFSGRDLAVEMYFHGLVPQSLARASVPAAGGRVHVSSETFRLTHETAWVHLVTQMSYAHTVVAAGASAVGTPVWAQLTRRG